MAPQIDVLVVGAGFHGLCVLHELRKLGFSVQCVEAGSAVGGVWHWNRYPGLRVDVEVPIYQFAAPELWSEWTWTQRYPDRDELCKYFEYVVKKWDLSSSILLNTTVTRASFNNDNNTWTTITHFGRIFKSSFLILCTGYGSKPYIPTLKGLEKFEGICHHTARWPEAGVILDNQRVGIVGTGATGVQIIQSIAPKVAALTVFQRTPNHALPMYQRSLSPEEQNEEKRRGVYVTHYLRRQQTFAGTSSHFATTKLADTTKEERQLYFEYLWKQGRFWERNYAEVFLQASANTEAYIFWRDKVRQRIVDRTLWEYLAPDTPAHPFGAKRPSLELNYFEAFNQKNVSLIDVKKNPIVEVTSRGVITADGILTELDVLILATGFEAISGGITSIDIRGCSGTSISDKWKNGVYTHLGLMTHDFPNMFIMYGPHSPSPFSVGPASAEMQSEWIINCLVRMRRKKLLRIEATIEAEQKWRKLVNEVWGNGLWAKTKSWYTGANIPGKVTEALAFAGSLPVYRKMCAESASNDYEGFTLR